MNDFQKKLLLKGVGAVPRPCLDFFSRLRWHNSLVNRLMTYAARGLHDCDLVIQHGLGRGLRFNTGDSAVSFVLGSSQRLEQLAFGALLKKGMAVYDVGANVGFFAIIAARIAGPGGTIFCFEPMPVNLRQIEHNANLNGFTNIRIVEGALGNIDGEARFWMSAEPTWGKLVSTGKLPDKMIGETTVSIRRLDGLGLPPPDVIKIDVEGAEVDVLLGGIETLRKYRPRLLIELHGTNAAVAELLSALDYKTAVLGDSAPLTSAHWNAIVVAIPSEQDWPAGLSAPSAKESAIGGPA